AFAIAIALAFVVLKSINFVDMSEAAAKMPVESFTLGAFAAGGLTTIAILMFIGATGKSAQIPLYVWLPDAMAGPTPVSALIHAATMVTAGVYLVSRSSAIFVKAPSAMFVVAAIGALTALFAATIGLAQWDIKKVLAYSTISQLGYMFLACGVGAFGAGVFHVMTHAFFKALLFLGSGSVILGMHHEQDMRRMGGLRKYMPITHATMVTGWLAICGIPIFAGFFSKDEILYQAYMIPGLDASTWGKVFWFVGAATALLTAVYMTRLMVLTFWTPERFNQKIDDGHDAHGDDHGHHHGLGDHKPHESPASMTVPLIILAVLATFGGLIGIPNGLGAAIGIENSNKFEHFLEPAIAPPVAGAEFKDAAIHEAAGSPAPASAEPVPTKHDSSLELLFTLLSVVIASVGIFVGFAAFKNNPLRKLPQLLVDKWRIDELYEATIIRPINWFSTEILWKAVDVRSIDGMVNFVGSAVRGIGGSMRHLQTGLARSYVAVILLGAAVIVGYFVVQGYLIK
ncbi:MAG TPA: NADH-quinone oxidoreductase subunit L, partial [Blastocatellia bacterium]|nr:NADH-quinone oxidoreductase subunit L [Blastocatellia bacterium]